jgi:hypothetical protein
MMTRFLVYLALVSLVLSAVHVQAQTTFISPIYKQYFPVVTQGYSLSKKGLANSWASKHLCDAQTIGAAWQYSYYPAIDKCGSVESVPMIKTPEMMNVTIRNDSPFIMMFNEPDGYLTPDEAVTLWMKAVAMYPSKMFVSPAPSHNHPEWLEQFLEACAQRGCKLPSALAAHCYLSEPQCETYVLNVIQLANQWGVPQVWVTEFAFDSVTDLKFVAWLEVHVDRYAYFTNRGDPTALLDQNGQMTQYGEAYRK